MKRLRLGLLLVLIVLGGPVRADGTNGTKSASGAEVSLAAEGNSMTAEEMVRAGDKIVGECRTAKDRAEAALRTARGDKDIERMDCINEGLIALKGVLNLAEGYNYDLKAQKANRKASRTEFIKLNIAYQKFQELDAQIRSCGGPAEQGIVEGRPVIQWANDQDLPDAQSVDQVDFWQVYLERPSVASPYH